MAIARIAIESGDEHQRAVNANHSDNVPQHVLPAPLTQGFAHDLGIAVVDQGCEVLVIQTVVAVGNQQFLGSDQAQPVKELRSHGVGTRLPAVQREQGGPHSLAATQMGQGPPLLVVGVGGGVENACGRLQALEMLPQPDRAPVDRQGARAGPRLRQHQDLVEIRP